MYTMNKLFFYIAIICIAFNSCISKKTLIAGREDMEITSLFIYDSIRLANKQIESFSARFTGSFSIDKTIESKGSIRIKRDSIIWISLSPLLIEAVRCVFTPDSVFIINRLERSYYAGTYDILEKFSGFTVNFWTLQAIFLNEFWLYPSHNDSLMTNAIAHYTPNITKDKILLEPAEKQSNLELNIPNQSYSISRDAFRVSATHIFDHQKQTAFSLSYSNFETFDSIVFPLQFTFTANKNNARLGIGMEYSRVDFNSNLSFPFSINPNFTPWE